MTDFIERRSRVRVEYEAAITLCPEGLAHIAGQCANVSMDGIFVGTEIPLQVGISCGVRIVLQGPNSTLTIDIEGVVARAEQGAVAVQFRDNLEWWAIFTIYGQYSGNRSISPSFYDPRGVE